MISAILSAIYRGLGALACVAMLAAFGSVALGVLAREFAWDIQGLDAYAGYAIAAALFLALPATFKRGEHIRVTLVLERLAPRARRALELWCLLAGLALAVFMSVHAIRLAWVSYLTHDVSPAMDVTPLWIPQIAILVGCLGFTLAMLDALICFVRGREFFDRPGDEAAHAE